MACPPDCPDEKGTAPTGVLNTNLETIKKETQEWPGKPPSGVVSDDGVAVKTKKVNPDSPPPPPPPPRESSGQKIKRKTKERNRQWLIDHGEDPDDSIFN